eukprot:629769-Pleurochrysis_carterae.AAC.1
MPPGQACMHCVLRRTLMCGKPIYEASSAHPPFADLRVAPPRSREQRVFTATHSGLLGLRGVMQALRVVAARPLLVDGGRRNRASPSAPRPPRAWSRGASAQPARHPISATGWISLLMG